MKNASWKKTEAEIGKTRPCIVYVKNLKESEAIDIINSSTTTTSGKQTTTQRIATRRTIKEQELDQLVELETTRTTRNSKRVTTVTNVEPTKSKIVSSPRTRNTKTEQTVLGPKAAAKTAKQPIKPVATPLTNRRNTAVVLPVVRPCTPLSKRRDTLTQSPAQSQTQSQHETDTEPEPQQPISESKAKMYKQSKLAASAVATSPAPPPTIAASRSRRSIKPNPKYASDDMVTPKYMGVLGNENPSKRTVKHLFADDDDDEEDEDLRDLIEEDNDDELTDAAFNPQLHKSDDDDDISERDFEQQLRREKVQPKRGRGRPPKSASAASSASNNNNSSMQSQTGRGGATQLQQLRRTMTPNLSRSHVKLMSSSSPSVGNKRKLEEHNDAPIARKRMTTSDWPVINGSTSMTKTSSMTLAKPKVVSGASNATGGGSLRMLQSSNAKPRPTSTFKMTTATAGNVRQAGSGQVMRTGTVGRPPGSTNTLKVQKASAANAAAIKAAESDDVPTFTIVNIDDIINQDDVLISRSSSHSNGSSKKLHAVARSNNTSRTTQTTSSTSTTAISNRHIGGTPGANASHKRLKTIGSGMGMGAGATAKHPLAINHNKQTSLVVSVGQAKPRPRILNAEMGRKTQPMTKPLMSMSKELCPMTDGDDNTEDEDMANELTEDDITISPPPAAANQQRLVRRVQTTNPKWLPNRRHVLSAAASSNNQRQQQQHHQQQQQHHNQQQQHHHQQQDRKLTKLLGENSDDDVFKKPASPSTSTPALRRYKEHAAADEDTTSTDPEPEITKQQPKYFPPETTTYCEEDGRIVKKITCYETWHVISTPKEPSNKTRQQRTCLELALVKLANMASRIKVPSSKWTSKVTLYKLSPSLMQRQTMTVFTGDLKSYNIPEEERHKYQPSCVLFRRSVLDRSKCRVPFDRAIIFKNKCFYANIEGKHVNLLGAPEVVNSIKDVEILIDIVDSLALSSNLVETVTSK